jgi:hypothetical protein
VAFKAWKIHQLPLLEKQGLKVRDLSRDMDPTFRSGYHGGIVDVYRPYLQGEGYYYDVNSLYPTAMCCPMPVGEPSLVELAVKHFKEGNFFGYLGCTIEAPSIETPGGYIGLFTSNS